MEIERLRIQRRSNAASYDCSGCGQNLPKGNFTKKQLVAALVSCKEAAVSSPPMSCKDCTRKQRQGLQAAKRDAGADGAASGTDTVAGDAQAGSNIAAEVEGLMVVSLGCNCLTAYTLRQLGLRSFSGPFDWIYSTPAMVDHAVRDGFSSFLDRSQLTGIGGFKFKASHTLYSPMVCSENSHVTNGVLFNHHDPLSDEGHGYFKRTVQRFEHVMRCPNQKLLALFSIEAWGPADDGKLMGLFRTLVEVARATRFVLLVVKIAAPAPAGGAHGRRELPCMRATANGGSCRMEVHELACRGEVAPNLDLTDSADNADLAAIVTGVVQRLGVVEGAGVGGDSTPGSGGAQIAPDPFLDCRNPAVKFASVSYMRN